jgi:hypothetical protein
MDLKLYRKLYYQTNKERIRKRYKEYYRQNPEKYHDKWLQYKYKITIEEYNNILERQHGVCKICKKRPNKRALAVDHSHLTGEIRGLLCTGCNIRLAWFEKYNVEAHQYLLEDSLCLNAIL